MNLNCMKKTTFVCFFLALLASALVLGGCKSDEPETTVSDRCFIQSLTLGNVYQTHYIRGSQGQDSSYTTLFAGSLFPMTVNQRKNMIENLDSLPFHSRVNRLRISAEYTSALVWRKPVANGDTDTLWHVFSEKDSLDFSTPLEFAAVSSNGINLRKYLVQVNVHRQRGDTTVWQQEPDIPVMSDGARRKILVVEGNLYVLWNTSDSTLQCARRSVSPGAQWVSQNTGQRDILPECLQVMGGKLFASTKTGGVLYSNDGLKWEPADFPVLSGLQLVAASDNRLYALAQGQLLSCSINGGNWINESLDDESTCLPQRNIRSLFYTSEYGIRRLLLVGEKLVGGKSSDELVSWSKVWNKGAEEQSTWMYYTLNGNQIQQLPTLAQMNLLYYDGGLLVVGGADGSGKYKPMSLGWGSFDHGLSWQSFESRGLNIAPELQQSAALAQQINVVVDAENYLWVFVGNKLWRGRMNRMGFLRQDP